MPRLGGGGYGLWIALLLGASCDGTAPAGSGSPSPVAPPTAQALVTGAPVTTGGGGRPGLRVDLAGTTHHVRALELQPDGTYKTVCTDSADGMRPAGDRPPGGQR
jgi:hypothetical protein